MYILSVFLIFITMSLSSRIKLPNIKHLVISGGGAAGFSYYGVLKQTQQKGLWQPENIKTIYATSAGTFLAVIISLGYDWKTLDDYLIKRPWQKVYKFELSMAIHSIINQGIFDLQKVSRHIHWRQKVLKIASIRHNGHTSHKDHPTIVRFCTHQFYHFDNLSLLGKYHMEYSY